MAFQPPGPDARRAAIGNTRSLSKNLRFAFEPSTDFESVPEPGPQDWLAVHPEPSQTSQTFCQFEGSRPNKPDGMRRKIYLQPLGEFAASCSPSLERLHEYAATYFALETDTLLAVQEKHFPTRRNPLTKNRQVLTTDVLRFLVNRLPPDAFCVLRSGDHDGGFVSGADVELRFRASLAAGAGRRLQLRAIRSGFLWPKAHS